MLQILQNQSILTMSSREIAELIGKSHSNIKISAERLADSGVIGTLASQEFTHNNNSYTEYRFTKRDCLVLVAQNSPEFTATIVDRWQELENKNNPMVVAATMNSSQLSVLMAETQAKEEAQHQLALARPAVAFVERYVESTGNLGFREVCKLLKAKENEFRSFLKNNHIMYQLAGQWTAYAEHINAGRFYVTTGTADNEHAFTSAKFTPKGVEWVSKLWNNCLH